jgi:DNA-binding beta-propeller fold protein YncE
MKRATVLLALPVMAAAHLFAARRELSVAYVGEWIGGKGGGYADDVDGPIALALGTAGRVYIAMQGGSRVQVFTTDGRFVRSFGQRWECRCQPGDSTNARFFLPSGVAVDSAGSVYVSDLGHEANGWPSRVQKFSPDGTFLAAWEGSAAGPFSYVRDVATDASGNVYVADWGHHRVQVLAGDGGLVTAWGGPGFLPWSLAFDGGRDRLYVDESLSRREGNNTLGYFQIGAFSPAGNLLEGWSATSQPGTKIAVDRQGRIYGTVGAMVKVYTPGGEWLGEWGFYGSGPGQFSQATGIAVDDQGLVYVADFMSARVQIFRVSFD